MATFIVCWTEQRGIGFHDHWATYENEDEARARLAYLKEQEDVWTASVSVVLDSTDYTPVPVTHRRDRRGQPVLVIGDTTEQEA